MAGIVVLVGSAAIFVSTFVEQGRTALLMGGLILVIGGVGAMLQIAWGRPR